MNPMELMQFSRDLDDFQANHPTLCEGYLLRIQMSIPNGYAH